MKTEMRGGAVLGARGPGIICRSANESWRAAMGCGREVAAHALWGDTAPRHSTPFTFGDGSSTTESYAPWWAHRESMADSRPGLPHSLWLRPAAPAALQTVAPRRARARSGAHLDALWRTHEHSGAIIGNQQHSAALRQHSVAPRRRPTPSSSERALLPPLPLTALPASRPPFASPRAS